MFKSKKNDVSGLHIIIIGYGKVGSTLVEQLSTEGHAITVIDRDAAKIQEVVNLYDVMGITGNGASYATQKEAGIDETDLLIAVTESDELNLLCCTLAKQAVRCATIARVRTPDYSKEAAYLRERLGLAMIINPELEAANEAARILSLPTALEVNSFAHGQAELIKIKIPDGNKLDGIAVSALGSVVTANILISAIERKGEIHIPNGDFTIHAGDTISFVASRDVAKAFMEQIGIATNQVRDTMIIGGGKAAYYLAKQLLHMGIAVKIVESDRERCEQLSVLLPNAIIINGDGTDQQLLREEGIEEAAAFVPLTGIDEENIMLTLYARQVSKAKVITKINHINFRNVISQLDLGSAIYPRYITAEAIVAYVRAKNDSRSSNIETLYHMFDNRAEAIEFRVDGESKVTNVPLKDLPLKKNLLISFISRNEQILFPSGKECIMAGDTVMIVTTNPGFKDIKDILM
ncbi:MAG: Trk system potassium transporter TrkA [Lachnospiraceae bacterium]|nr:Trk system potassium transporter TrkA [Lachnospiraceae bacterium]